MVPLPLSPPEEISKAAIIASINDSFSLPLRVESMNAIK